MKLTSFFFPSSIYGYRNRASLSSARGSIVSLEIANKDLLEALSNKGKELEGAKAQVGELNVKLANKDKELEKSKVHNDSLSVELHDLKTIMIPDI